MNITGSETIIAALITTMGGIIVALIGRKSRTSDKERLQSLPADILAIPADRGLTKQQQSLFILQARMGYVSHPETIVEYLGPGKKINLSNLRTQHKQDAFLFTTIRRFRAI